MDDAWMDTACQKCGQGAQVQWCQAWQLSLCATCRHSRSEVELRTVRTAAELEILNRPLPGPEPVTGRAPGRSGPWRRSR